MAPQFGVPGLDWICSFYTRVRFQGLKEYLNFVDAHNIENDNWFFTEELIPLRARIKKEIKMKFASILLMFLTFGFVWSCNKYSGQIENEGYINHFICDNFGQYKVLYEYITNYIHLKSNLRMEEFVEKQFLEWQVDSLILFNYDQTKLYTTINTRAAIWYGGTSDLVQEVYGVKVNGEWLIFLGASLIISREGYKRNVYEPFSWQELSFVAHEQLFSKFLTINNVKNKSFQSDILDKVVTPDYLGGSLITTEGDEKDKYLEYLRYRNSKIVDSMEFEKIFKEYEYKKEKFKKNDSSKGNENKSIISNDLVFESKVWELFLKNKCKI